MNNLLVKDFLEKRKDLGERECLIYTIAYNIAPTLMKVKPATIINITKDIRNSYIIWEMDRDSICHELNVKAFELKKTNNNIFILFYNNDFLYNVLNNGDIKHFLLTYSYEVDEGIEAVLNKLRKRFSKGCPNEIGIFLGIPLEDVQEYIKNSGENYKSLSYWKVYNDIEKAEIISNLYDKSKELVLRNILSNKLNKG